MKQTTQKKAGLTATEATGHSETSLLWDTSDEKSKAVPILSQDGIKLVFDVVKNYAVVLVVALGAAAFSETEIVKQRHQLGAWVSATIFATKWFLYGLSAILALLNGLYATYVFELTPFYRSRRGSARWAIVSITVSTLLGFSILWAIYLAKVKGRL